MLEHIYFVIAFRVCDMHCKDEVKHFFAWQLVSHLSIPKVCCCYFCSPLRVLHICIVKARIMYYTQVSYSCKWILPNSIGIVLFFLWRPKKNKELLFLWIYFAEKMPQINILTYNSLVKYMIRPIIYMFLCKYIYISQMNLEIYPSLHDFKIFERMIQSKIRYVLM